MFATPRRPRFLFEPGEAERSFVAEFLRRETTGGAIVLVAATIAVVWANSPVADSYQAVRELRLGPLDLAHWGSEGALTLFFFVAGLELKRELVVGSLRRPRDAVVPVVAAIGGVAVPALVYAIVNLDSGYANGWAIPAATDIAFALAVLAVAGSFVPDQLRAFLLTLAVVDDLIIIIIIAVFYTSGLDPAALLVSIGFVVLYGALQRLRVRTSVIYVPVAVVAWWFMHESGVHATIAGVALGLLTRVLPDASEDRSPAERLEHRLVPLSAGVAVPFFALLAAGVTVGGLGTFLDDPIVLGVVLGLVVGKPLGVMGGAWLVTRFTRAELNEDLTWRDIIGVAVLAGVGFTVALLVADLSFDGARLESAKTAVLAGSLAAATLGALILGRRSRRLKAEA